jgi:hypothetical protein
MILFIGGCRNGCNYDSLVQFFRGVDVAPFLAEERGIVAQSIRIVWVRFQRKLEELLGTCKFKCAFSFVR